MRPVIKSPRTPKLVPVNGSQKGEHKLTIEPSTIIHISLDQQRRFRRLVAAAFPI
jgi:hypothetical protein